MTEAATNTIFLMAPILARHVEEKPSPSTSKFKKKAFYFVSCTV